MTARADTVFSPAPCIGCNERRIAVLNPRTGMAYCGCHAAAGGSHRDDLLIGPLPTADLLTIDRLLNQYRPPADLNPGDRVLIGSTPHCYDNNGAPRGEHVEQHAWHHGTVTTTPVEREDTIDGQTYRRAEVHVACDTCGHHPSRALVYATHSLVPVPPTHCPHPTTLHPDTIDVCCRCTRTYIKGGLLGRACIPGPSSDPRGIHLRAAAHEEGTREPGAPRATWPPTENAPCSGTFLDALAAGIKRGRELQQIDDTMRTARRDLTAAVQAGQAAATRRTRPAAPIRHDPDMWARVYDALDRWEADRQASTYALTLAALDAAHPDGSRRPSAAQLHTALFARADAEALLQDIRRAIDTHAAGPWLGTELRERLEAATTASLSANGGTTGSNDT